MSMGWINGGRNLGWLVVACGLLAGSGAAQAQDASALSGRLDRLERDLQVLQRQAYRDQSGGSGGGGDAASSEGTAQLFVKISQLEEQMRDLTGQIEQLSFKIDQNQQRLDRMSSDVDYRFQSLEKGPSGATGTGAVAEPPPATTQTSGSTVGVLGATQGSQPAAPAQPAQGAENAADAYRDAFNLLKKADYPAAEVAFQTFLKQHADTEYAGNAQYWLGETYYVRGQFEKAAVAFADGYKKYRKGPKAPDSLLKLGFSMRKLNQNDKACAALDQFLKEFAGAPKVQVDLAQKNRTEMKCR